jgi:ADP-ribose pyrophosphatase YjhB (NUDIX family)
VLLVENVEAMASDWTPPGGVIDHGESVTAGLG